MEDRSVDSESLGSLGTENNQGKIRSQKEWHSGDERLAVEEDDDEMEHSDEGSYSECSGSYDSEHDTAGSNHSRGSRETFDDEMSEHYESDTAGGRNEIDESSTRELKTTNSEETGGRSDDETDTCLLSIDEHVRRRRAKMALRDYKAQKARELKAAQSEDSASLDRTRSDDETDTCMLSIEDHVRRRQAKWMKLRNGTEAIDLTCLDSDVGTLEETTLVSVEEDEEEEYEEDEEEEEEEESYGGSVSVQSRTLGSKTYESGTIASATVESLSPIHEQRRAESKRTENWRIRKWRKEGSVKEATPEEKDHPLKGVDYMSAFEMASTNKDISVVEGGISKKVAREAFEKKEVPNEIPMMLRDDVSSIYPPVRAAVKPYPPKRQPFNGMILEDAVDMDYDEELGASTKSYEMSIVGSEEKKKSLAAQRSDLELVLIGIISFSLLVLVILLIVILAKNS